VMIDSSQDDTDRDIRTCM